MKAQRDIARIHYRLGAGYAQAGQSVEAIGYLRQALALQRPLSTASPNDESLATDTAGSCHFLGMALRGAGEYKEAVEVLNEAIKIRELSLSRDSQNARSRALLAATLPNGGPPSFRPAS